MLSHYVSWSLAVEERYLGIKTGKKNGNIKFMAKRLRDEILL